MKDAQWSKEHIIKDTYDYSFQLVERKYMGELIRCKDCKYYKENTLACSRYGLEDDDYCSWAERKEP